MRHKTDYIIIHCSDTPKEMDVGVKEIDVWHRERGWRGCGYHKIIKRNGQIEQGREDRAIGAHCRGKNSSSIGICMIGGKGGTNFTLLQWRALDSLVRSLVREFPNAKVVGHNSFSNKECPTFDAEAWWQNS